MFFLTVILISLAVGFNNVAADPEYERIKQLMNIHAREEDLSFCFGRNSICSAANDLHSDCSDSNDGDSLDPWWKCLCGNGYVAVNEACYWCEQVYHISDAIYAGDTYTSACSSVGVTIAPIPSSVLALQSSYNSTYTGIISGVDAQNTGSPVASASTTDGESSTTGGNDPAIGPTKTPSRSSSRDDSSPSRTTNSDTWFGGVTSVVTLNGGGDDDSGPVVTTDSLGGNSNPRPSNTLRAGGDPPGSAPGLNTGSAVVFSVVAFCLGVSVMYLM